MRSPVTRLLMLLVAMLVGLQSMASAMGMRCTMGDAASNSTTEDAHRGHSMGGHHAMTGMDHGSVAAHAHHDGGQGSSNAEGSPFCECGPACVMASCLGSGPGLVSVLTAQLATAPMPAFQGQQPVSAPHAAHGLDLFRPPSKS